MNPPFGPFYPSELQAAVNHAERVAALIARVRASPRDAEGAAWIAGRAEEIEAVVALVADEWTRAGISVATAARKIDVYVETLHRGLALHFPNASLACCSAAFATTELPASPTSSTVEIEHAAPPPCDVEATTMDVDPSELLAGIPRSTI